MTVNNSTDNSTTVPVVPHPEKVSEQVAQGVMPKITGHSKGLFEKTVGLSLSVSRVGNRKKVDASRIHTDADRNLIGVSKKLLDCKEMEAIAQRDREFRKYLVTNALPSMFKSGLWLIPLNKVDEVDAKLKHYIKERRELVNEFMAVYEEKKLEAATKLGSLYDPKDYPSEHKVRWTFKVEYLYLEFTTPQNLKSIRAGMLEEEQNRLRTQMQESMDEIRGFLRSSIQEMLAHAVDRLADGPGGKKKILHETVLSRITQFAETFKEKNICDDEELDDIIVDLRKLTQGVDIKSLRGSNSVRRMFQKSVATIKKDVDNLVGDTRAGRAFGD